MIDVAADVSRLVEGFDKADRESKDRSKKIIGYAKGIGAAFAGVASAKIAADIVNQFVDTADATGKLAQKLGYTTEELSKYQYAIGFAAIEQKTFNAANGALIRRLNNFQRDGGGAGAKGFEALGISAEYAREHMATTDSAMREVLKRLEEMPDGYKKTAAAQDIFSKEASGMLKLTLSDLEKFGDEAERIGVTIPQHVYDMAAVYHDEMDRLNARFMGIQQTVSFGVLPAMTAASTTAVQMYDEMFGGTAQQQMDTFGDVAIDVIGGVVTGVGYMTDAWTGMQVVVKTFELGVYALGNALVDGVVNTFIAGINEISEGMNTLIAGYNKFAGLIGAKQFELFGSIEYINVYGAAVDETRQELFDLVDKLENGRITAEQFNKKLAENFESVKQKAKGAGKPVDDLNDAIKNLNASGDDLKLDAVSSNIVTQFDKATAAIDAMRDPVDRVNDAFFKMYDVVVDIFDESQMQQFYAAWDKAIGEAGKKNEETLKNDFGTSLSIIAGEALADGIKDGIQNGDWQQAFTGVLSAIGSTLGAQLGEDLGAAAGEGIGGALGAAAGPVGGALGSVAGELIGSALGGLFGGNDGVPWLERKLDNIEADLEAQTRILESSLNLARALGSDGTAIIKKLEIAAATYDADISAVGASVAAEIYASMPVLGAATGSYQEFFAGLGLGDGFPPPKGEFTDAFNSGNALQIASDANDLGAFETQAEYDEIVSGIIAANEDYAAALLEQKDTILGIAQSLSDIYEGITGDDLLGDQMLSDAREDVAQLMSDAGFDSFTDYIADLAQSAYEYGTSIKNLSSDLQSDDANVQAAAVATLSEITGMYFESSQDALDYMSSIELVGAAMVASAENMREWERSQMTLTEQLRAAIDASPATVAPQRGGGLLNPTQDPYYGFATTQEELNEMYDALAQSGGELTDAELERLQLNEQWIDAMDRAKTSMLAYLDGLDGGTRKLDEAMARLGIDAIPSTVAAAEALYAQFLEGDGVIDEYEQAILDATAAQVAATQQISDSASSMYESLYGEQTPAQQAMTSMLELQGQMFVDSLGGLQTVLQLVADGELELTDAQWAQVQALYEVESSTADTAQNTADIARNTRPDTPYIDDVLSDFRDRKRAESDFETYADQYAELSEEQMKDIAALGAVWDEFDDILGSGGSKYAKTARINDVLDALGLGNVSGAPDAPDIRTQLIDIFESSTGYTTDDADAIARLLSAMDILGDSATAAADALGDMETDALHAAQSLFARIRDDASGFIDAQYANNTDYTGALLQSNLYDALNLTDLIKSGGDYTEDDLDRLSNSTAAASDYARKYLGSLDADSYEYRLQQNVLAHSFSKIGSEASAREKTFADVVDALDVSHKNEAELIELSQLLLKAINQLRKTTQEGLTA